MLSNIIFLYQHLYLIYSYSTSHISCGRQIFSENF